MTGVRTFPAGTVAECPFCGLALYRLTADHSEGEVARASDMVRVNAVHEPAVGTAVTCPEHGEVMPHWIRP